MKKLIVLCLLLAACKSIPVPVVLTETKQGEPVTMTAVQETADRQDIPADVAPREVVAKVETKTGAKVWVVKKSAFKPPVVYQNAQAKKEGIAIAQPKDPWWKWPLIAFILIAVIAAVVLLDRIKGFLFFWKR